MSSPSSYANCQDCGAANLPGASGCLICGRPITPSIQVETNPHLISTQYPQPKKALRLRGLVLAGLLTSGGLILGFGLVNFTSDPRVDEIRTAAEQTISTEQQSELRRLAPAVDPGSATEYEFLYTDTSGEPTGLFSPCEPVQYQVDTTYEPEGARLYLDMAIMDLEKATGLVFQFAGNISIDVLADPSQLDEDGPVKIVFLPNPQFNELRDLQGDSNPDEPLAFAGPSVLSLNIDREQFIATGGRAVFDNSWIIEELSYSSDGVDLRATTTYMTFVHELAHVLGLGHVNDETELMHPVQTRANESGLGPGDLAGLAKAGQGACGVDPQGELVFPAR